MPPPINQACLDLVVLPQTFTVKQYPADGGIPLDIRKDLDVPKVKPGLLSVTRTAEEVSIVSEVLGDGGDWKCIKIAGPMEFDLTGVICSFTTPLKHADVPVFAVSTWNTDYVLVPKVKIGRAVEVLSVDGWKFTDK
ncbi:ACT domain-containing protein [Phlebopus sp. FC_14]|nr:ACT domain-containing protein [Phlebopus sp. FC_14]